MRTSPSWQILKLDWKRHELQYPGGCQCGWVWVKSYPSVRLGAPAKLKYLHSKIGRRVDFSSYKKPVCSQSGGAVCIARVRYDTRMRGAMVAKVGGVFGL